TEGLAKEEDLLALVRDTLLAHEETYGASDLTIDFWFFNFDHLIKPSFKTSKPRIESYEIPSEIPHCLVPYVLRQRVVYSSHK
ncbi:hypothetical protein, partial [Bacillus safensis]|uniref:hypothetical protein n=1 Tax=Bacillus safensis TaxID=561879 RepID=UPI003D02EFB0